jgi:cytochrome c peroxidase
MLEPGEAKLRLVSTLFASLLLLSVATASSLTAAERKPIDEQVLAPGWNQLEFEPPEAGSYQLPPMGMAGNGRVLTTEGKATNLHDLMGDKVVVLSFIYSSCSDANGCPLATHVLEKLQDELLIDPGAGDGVRFISLSFDPVQDTPEAMKRNGSPYISGGFDWHFLTTSGPNELDPILESYGQSIIRDPNAEEGEAGSTSHVLRVFLVDRKLRIRNIFSASYLHADTMLNDIRTLRMEPAEAPALQGPGDVKVGYENRSYRTQAQSLQRRKGMSAQLWNPSSQPPLGLPPIPVPADNPLTPEKIELGRLLFFDRRLSHNNTISCAMCHVPEQGFTSNELATAVGIEGRTVRRNSPTIYNVAYLQRLFLDGRETTLEQQIWGPLLARNEMGNPSVGLVIEQIKGTPEYVSLFEHAFGGQAITMETIGKALASYERVLVSANSAFDRWYYARDEAAMTIEQQAGFRLFTGKAGCSGCHRVEKDWAIFTDNQLHNTGIGYQRSMAKTPESMRVQIAPGEHITVQGDIVADASEPRPGDLGLYEITEDPNDRWKYRTPTLRNVELTAPYMHDGSLSSLVEVIEFYNRGGVENELRDPLIRPLGLNEAESGQLLAFLKALTGENVDRLVADAFSVPVGNTGSENSNK